jgi:hypothetical protein
MRRELIGSSVVKEIHGDALRPAPRQCGVPIMCASCKQLDDQIARYRLFLCRITDQRTLDGIRLLIQQMDAEKERLHGDKPRVEIIEFVSRMQS